jgi:pyruvate/2-oxoglutarate dehydrogenase complex dihydrolipoamide acyltransferase (E2) component
MAHPVHAPRVNNNDDTVTVVRLAVAVGERVSAGTLILEVETEKAAIAVEAERDGYVLALLCQEGDTIGVGAVAVWLGDQPDEAVPCAEPQSPVPPAAEDAITGKARLLLRRHGLTAEMIPRRGGRPRMSRHFGPASGPTRQAWSRLARCRWTTCQRPPMRRPLSGWWRRTTRQGRSMRRPPSRASRRG